MKGLAVAAVGCALGTASAKLTRWSRDRVERDWVQPRETLAVMPQLFNPPAPLPTDGPKLKPRMLEKRASTDNTCAYVSGSTEVSLYCDATAYCAYDSSSHVGCCDDSATTSCKVWTTCYDRTESDSYTTNNGLTLWCGLTQYPHCLTHVYADTTGAATSIRGYTLYGCAVAGGTDKVFYTAFTGGSSTTERDPIETDFGDPATASGDSTAPITTTVVTETAKPQSSSSSTPVGAIAGGVVGGVAALGLIGLGIWFLVRQSNKDKGGSPNPAPANLPPHQPPNGGGFGNGFGGASPQMAQMSPPPQDYYGGPQPPVAGFAPVDPRHSIAHPHHTSTVYEPSSFSPPDSPPPQQSSPFQDPHSTPSPPPQAAAASAAYANQAYQQSPTTPPTSYNQQPPQQYGYQQQPQGGGYPQQGAFQQAGYPQPAGYPQQAPYPQQGGYQPPNQGYTELPTQRGDGEVRELQG